MSVVCGLEVREKGGHVTERNVCVQCTVLGRTFWGFQNCSGISVLFGCSNFLRFIDCGKSHQNQMNRFSDSRAANVFIFESIYKLSPASLARPKSSGNMHLKNFKCTKKLRSGTTIKPEKLSQRSEARSLGHAHPKGLCRWHCNLENGSINFEF